jgi:hypothetical protein
VGYTVVNANELRNYGSTSEFEGYLHADTDVSFILVDFQPGEGYGSISTHIRRNSLFRKVWQLYAVATPS